MLQAGANRIVDCLPILQSLDIADPPPSSSMDYTNNNFAVLCQFERLAAKQATHDANNHLLAQLLLTIEKETAAVVFEQDAWENNKSLVPIKYLDIALNSNVIGLHTIFERKGSGRVKACLVL